MVRKTFATESTIFITVLILLVLSVLMVYSASSFKAQERFEDSNYFLTRHFYKVLTGLLLMLLVSRIHYNFWLKFSPLLLLVSLAMLLYILLSPGVAEIRGSKRWLSIMGFEFQPSDLARLSLILFLSFSLARAPFWSHNPCKRFFFHLAVIIAVTLPIFLQPDIGSGILLTAIAVTLIFISGDKLRYLFVPVLTSSTILTILILKNAYVMKRILEYWNSIRGIDVSWQTLQSLIALGNGSVLGLGLGGSHQKYHFLPDPFTDFIFAIIGEELGIFGTFGALALLVFLIWCGFRIALAAPDMAAGLLAFGITFNIAIYAFTNIAVVVNLLPTTGIPAPFLSYGGSAMLSNLFGVGILLSIAREVRHNRLLVPVRGTRRQAGFSYGR